MTEWDTVPHTFMEGKRFFPTPSCSDCTSFLIASFPMRKCASHPDRFMYSLGYSPESERAENGEVIAEGCPDFKLGREP